MKKNRRRELLIVGVIATSCSVSLVVYSVAADAGDVRTHAEQSFEQLQQHTGQKGSSNAQAGTPHKVRSRNR